MDNKTQAPQSTRRLSDILRETRVAKGLELSDVAEVTHVRKEYLQALDEGRYQDLPEDVYARNFVRLYAQTLGISDTQLLEKFKRERAAAREGASNVAAPERTPTVVGVHAAPEKQAVLPASPRTPQARAAAANGAGVAPGHPSSGSPPAPRDAAARPPRSGAKASAVIPVTRRSARDQAPANLDRDFWNGDPSRRRGGLLLWLAGLVVLTLVGAGIWWAASSLRPTPVGDAPPTATPPATAAPTAPGDVTGPAIIPLEPSEGAAPGETEAPPPSSVTLSVTSTPPGAEVSVDNFYLGNTPLQFPIRARESGVIRLTLEGYQTAEFSESLATNRTFNVELQALGANATEEATSTADSPAETAGSGGNIVITVETGPSWLEVWSGGARNEGERLLFTTAEPGQRFEFPLPVYVHAGAASNIRVSLNGQPAGALGSGGEVVGRLFR